MRRDPLELALDLQRADLDPEMFAAALAVRHISRLITHGGSDIGRPEDDSALHPHHLERFLARAVEMTQKTGHFEQEWRRLQRAIPHMKVAWEQGQALFQEDLTRAMGNPEEMEYLPHIDFAVDCYAYVTARNTYPHDQ